MAKRKPVERNYECAVCGRKIKTSTSFASTSTGRRFCLDVTACLERGRKRRRKAKGGVA